MAGNDPRGPRTLSIDIGGTRLKMLILDAAGEPLTERVRIKTPQPALPANILAALLELARTQGDFDRIAVGFPGVVVDGIVHTAVNLDDAAWSGFDLAGALTELTQRPARAMNDADMQGHAVIEGKGVEMVLTLGTGVGSALFADGKLVPNLELAHHNLREGKTYEDYLGKPALEKVGKKEWRRRVQRTVALMEPIWNYRLLHIGGGNSKHLQPGDLPANVRLVANVAGLLGGFALWREG